jgi:pyruvate dehydrogenase E2 component (dihydrolipoamide acetyltransferase)
MPKLSLTMKTGSVVQWFKKEGEDVKKGEPVVEILSEKVTYDVEAPATGVLKKVMAEEGMDLPVGATLAFVAAPDEEVSEAEIAEKAVTTTTEVGEEVSIEEEAETRPARERVLASPAAKRLAREHNVDLARLQGTGPDGRIVEEDVKRFVEEQRRLLTRVKEEFPLTGIRKTTAERVASSFQTAPHSFIIMDADMTNAETLRGKTRASYTAMLVSAAAKALHEQPTVNSTLAEGKIKVYEDVNVGVAVSTEKGLVVPVIRNADRKSLAVISSELAELASKAREGRLLKEELSGGTFTVTNLGMYDVDMFIPIINPPEAAILAAGRIAKKAVATNEGVAVRPMMTLTLAYDHRIIDGAPAATFLRRIKKIVEEELLSLAE